MKIVRSISKLREHILTAHSEGKIIGLVPTMGALHEGHASLIKRSIKECDLTIVSIFVNPTQFNDPKDLQHYPRTFDADCQLIAQIGDCFVFAPTVSEMYPEPDTRHFSYPPIDTVMEGARRPGHFNGVCQIVSKLFEITTPDRAYFGEKDFQQIAVIRAMMHDLGYNFKLISCPIIRESSGLALSSRNSLLTNEERQIAVSISKALIESSKRVHDSNFQVSIKDELQRVVDTLNTIKGLKVEYFEIVNGNNLQMVSTWDEAEHIQGCITVFCGDRPVRLIDNIKYK